MLYANEFNKVEGRQKEIKSFLTNTENKTESTPDASSSFFTESSAEETEVDQAELRTHLETIISDSLPGFYEFQQAGYNLLYPKKLISEHCRSG